MATTTKQLQQGTATTLLSSELASLTNGQAVTSSGSFTNTIGTSNWDGYPAGLFELSLGAPSAAFADRTGAFSIWFLRSLDGTNYEDVGPNGYPSRDPDILIFPEALSGAQRKSITSRIPVGKFKVCLLAAGLGTITLNGTNTLKVLPETVQQV